MPKKNSVPYGWRSLQAVGTRVAGTRFIPFKVPLKGVINQRLTPNQKFTPKDLIAEIKAQGEELGLVIDLTNTNRYYEVKDLPKNVKYQKLPTAGLEIPDDDTILQFKKIVRKFLRQNPYNATGPFLGHRIDELQVLCADEPYLFFHQDMHHTVLVVVHREDSGNPLSIRRTSCITSDKLIGVHCTTGLSRTGYLICRYLVDVEDWHPDATIKAFTDTRSLSLDGRVYVADLKVGRRRTNEGIDDVDDDELPAQADVPQFEEPARADYSERTFPGTQTWGDLAEQRGVEDGNFMTRIPFQENMHMEGYDHRRPVHGGLANDSTQEPRVFQRPGQRPGFPEERYDFGNGRNHELYQEPFAGQRGQNPIEEQYFNSRPEPRARPFSGEPRDFRDAGNPDLYDMPTGQRPKPFYGQSAQEDYKAQMHSEDQGFLNAKPGQRMRPLTQGEPRDFPSERVWDLQNQDTGPRQGPRGFSGPQGRASNSAMPMEDDFSKRGYPQRPMTYEHRSPSHGFLNDGPVDGRPFPDRDFGQRPYGPQSRIYETDLQMGKHDGANTAAPQRMRVPPDSRSPPFRMAPETEDSDFNGPARRQNTARDFSSYSAKPEAMGENVFTNRPGVRPYSIYDSQAEAPDRGYGRTGPRAFESQSNYPTEPLSERGPGYPAANKRMRLSDEGAPADRYAPPPAMGQVDNRRYYPTPADSSSDFSYGAPEASLAGRTNLPRRSRFH